jgi:hypothetical protein
MHRTHVPTAGDSPLHPSALINREKPRIEISLSFPDSLNGALHSMGPRASENRAFECHRDS